MKRRPSRRDLLCVIARLQGLVGEAEGETMRDLNPDRMTNVLRLLGEAHALAIIASRWDEPVSMIEESEGVCRVTREAPRG